MTTLALKNIPDDLYQRLENVARSKRRSVDEEALAALKMGLDREEMEVDTVQEKTPIPFRLRPHAIGLTKQTTFGREEIYGDHGR